MDDVVSEALNYLNSRSDSERAAVLTPLQVEVQGSLVDITLVDRGERAGEDRFMAIVGDDVSDLWPTSAEALADLKWVQLKSGY